MTRRNAGPVEGSIIHVRRLHFGGSGWQATRTTADCSRFIAQCGHWDTLAEAVPTLKAMIARGDDVRVSATASEITEAKVAAR